MSVNRGSSQHVKFLENTRSAVFDTHRIDSSVRRRVFLNARFARCYRIRPHTRRQPRMAHLARCCRVGGLIPCLEIRSTSSRGECGQLGRMASTTQRGLSLSIQLPWWLPQICAAACPSILAKSPGSRNCWLAPFCLLIYRLQWSVLWSVVSCCSVENADTTAPDTTTAAPCPLLDID